jgi:hypothetical protein
MSPRWRAPSSATSTSVALRQAEQRQGDAELVVERAARGVHHAAAPTAAAVRSLTVVLPTEPVMATVRGATRRRTSPASDERLSDVG